MRNVPRTDGRPGGASSRSECGKHVRTRQPTHKTWKNDAISPQQQRRRLSAMSNQCNCALRAPPPPEYLLMRACVCSARWLHVDEACQSVAHTWIMLPLCTRVHDQQHTQRMCVTLRWLLLDPTQQKCVRCYLRPSSLDFCLLPFRSKMRGKKMGIYFSHEQRVCFSHVSLWAAVYICLLL